MILVTAFHRSVWQKKGVYYHCIWVCFILFTFVIWVYRCEFGLEWFCVHAKGPLHTRLYQISNVNKKTDLNARIVESATVWKTCFFTAPHFYQYVLKTRKQHWLLGLFWLVHTFTTYLSTILLSCFTDPEQSTPWEFKKKIHFHFPYACYRWSISNSYWL
jgi:hypothetical protein